MAMVAAVAVTPSMAMSRVMRLMPSQLSLLSLPIIPATHNIHQESRDDKQQAVHDPERKAGLQDAARPIGAHGVDATGRRGEGDVPEGIRGR